MVSPNVIYSEQHYYKNQFSKFGLVIPIFIFLCAWLLTACGPRYKPTIFYSLATSVPQVMVTVPPASDTVTPTLINSIPLITPTTARLPVEEPTGTSVSPTWVGSKSDTGSVSPTEDVNMMLKVIQDSPLYYQELVDYCSRNYIADKPFYHFLLGSDRGYYLPFYHNNELCSIAFFSFQNGSLKIDWLISAGYTGNSQINEIAKAVYHDPFTFLNLINQCTKDFKIGTPVYVQILDSQSGYYVQPFINSKGLCFAASYFFQNGIWKFNWSTSYNAGINGDKYPQVSREDAIQYIEKMTCQKVVGEPQYVAALSSHKPLEPFGPFWKVSTSDGETYFVDGSIGPTDTDPSIILQIFAWNAKDDYKMWLEPKNCQLSK